VDTAAADTAAADMAAADMAAAADISRPVTGAVIPALAVIAMVAMVAMVATAVIVATDTAVMALALDLIPIMAVGETLKAFLERSL
jgi:hypothetical protein